MVFRSKRHLQKNFGIIRLVFSLLAGVHGGGGFLVQVPVHVCDQPHRNPSPNTLGTSFITGATLESRPRSVQVDLPGAL